MYRLWCVLLMMPATLFAAAEVPAPAATAGAAPGAAGSGLVAQLAQLVFGLLLVIGLIFFLAWLLRRFQQASPNGGQVIELIGAKALGPRDRLLLVQVGEEQILLGITPGRITPLHVLSKPVTTPDKTEQATPEFAQRLMELLGKDQKDKK